MDATKQPNCGDTNTNIVDPKMYQMLRHQFGLNVQMINTALGQDKANDIILELLNQHNAQQGRFTFIRHQAVAEQSTSNGETAASHIEKVTNVAVCPPSPLDDRIAATPHDSTSRPAPPASSAIAADVAKSLPDAPPADRRPQAAEESDVADDFSSQDTILETPEENVTKTTIRPTTLALTGRTQKLRKHDELRAIEERLSNIPKTLSDTKLLDVVAVSALLSDLDRYKITEHCLQLHPAILSALSSVMRLDRRQCGEDIRAFQAIVQRIKVKILQFHETCALAANQHHELRAKVRRFLELVQRVPLKLLYLAENGEQLRALLAALVGDPDQDQPAAAGTALTVDRLPAAVRLVFDRCQAMSTSAEFIASTNVRQLVSDEMALRKRDSADTEPIEETANEAIEEIYQTYVPMPEAWHCTLLADIRCAPPDGDHNADAAPMAANVRSLRNVRANSDDDVQLIEPAAVEVIVLNDTEFVDGGESTSAPASVLAQPPTVVDQMPAPAADSETTPRRTGVPLPPKRHKRTEASDVADAQPLTVKQEPVPARRTTDKATAIAAEAVEAPHRTALAERKDNSLHFDAFSQPADLPVARQRAAQKRLAGKKTKAAEATSPTSETPARGTEVPEPTASSSRSLAVTVALARPVPSSAVSERAAEAPVTADDRSGESEPTTATAAEAPTETTTAVSAETTIPQDLKPSMRSSVPLTGIRAELLRRHFDLRRIEAELLKLPKPIEPANCNVPECMRLMDEFDRFQITRRCLQLHPAFVSVLNRLLKMGKPTCKDPAVLALQQRICNKLQSFMEICNYTHKEGFQFRKMVVQHQMLLQKTPPELHYLAVTAYHFQRLRIIARLPDVPVEWATAAHRQCFERCRRMSGWAEFDRRTNVRQRIALEVQMAAEDAAAACAPLTPAEESTDATIETIFRTYVPMWQAWHCTLLQFVRLRAILQEVEAVNDMNDAAVQVKSEPTETPSRNDNFNDANDDDNDVVEVPTSAIPVIIELESVNDTQQLIEQLITPALEAEATTSDATNYVLNCLNDVSSTPPAVMAPTDLIRIDEETLQSTMSPQQTEQPEPVPVPVSGTHGNKPKTGRPTNAATKSKPMPTAAARKRTNKVGDTAADAADRTVVLRHDFEPLQLEHKTSADATAPSTTKKRLVSPTRPTPKPRSAALATDNAFVIEDASMQMVTDEENEASNSPPAAAGTQAGLDVECSMLASMPLGSASQLAASEATAVATANKVPAEAEAPADVQVTITAAAPSSTAPVDGPTAAATADRPSAHPVLPRYLKMTPLTHAAFDLSPSDDDDPAQFQRPISMRVRFGSDPHWTHLDEPSVRLLLQLPSDADWRCVRQVIQLVRRFEYSVFEAGAVRGRGLRRPLSIAEQVLWELLNSRTLETAGVTVAVDWRSDRGMVLELVELVREDLMADMRAGGMPLNGDEFMGREILRSLAQARAEEATRRRQKK